MSAEQRANVFNKYSRFTKAAKVNANVTVFGPLNRPLQTTECRLLVVQRKEK